MEFTLSDIVPCLQEIGAEYNMHLSQRLLPFSYADTLVDNCPAGSTGCSLNALSVLPIESTVMLEASSTDTRPVLFITADVNNKDKIDNVCKRHCSAACITTELSCTAVASAINRYLVSLREWDAQMATDIRSGCSTQHLLDLSESVIGSYIALTDALYVAVAITKSMEPLDMMSRELARSGSYPSAMIESIENLSQEQSWHSQSGSGIDQNGNLINPTPSMSRIYRLNGNYAAHLAMVCPAAIEPWRQRLFDMLADRIGECLECLWSTEPAYREKDTAFLTAILEGGTHDVANFNERARLFDFPITGVFEVGVINGAEERGGIAQPSLPPHTA